MPLQRRESYICFSFKVAILILFGLIVPHYQLIFSSTPIVFGAIASMVTAPFEGILDSDCITQFKNTTNLTGRGAYDTCRGLNSTVTNGTKDS